MVRRATGKEELSVFGGDDDSDGGKGGGKGTASVSIRAVSGDGSGAASNDIYADGMEMRITTTTNVEFTMA